MSHFSTLVILQPGYKPKDRIDANHRVEELLAPFDEHISVAPYQEKCWCVGRKAQHEAYAHAQKVSGLSWESCRNRLWTELPDVPRTATKEEYAEVEKRRDARWKELTGPLTVEEERAFTTHPLRKSPNPGCDACHGRGKRTTTYNPDSKWDWWVIGGRWTGQLVGYEPMEDPRNIETCDLCNGTGTRPGGRAQFGEEWFKGCNGCNGCSGKGTRVKFPTEWARFDGDVLPLLDVSPDFEPFAIVTPDGRWHEQGKMGWWAIVTNEKSEKSWSAMYHAITRRYPDSIAVLVDCHI